LFLPLFFVSVALGTKSWIDGICGRDYRWAKTVRAGDVAAVLSGSPSA
jgi:hypothetical protein